MSKIPRVGKKNGIKEKYLSYTKVEKDSNGWIDASRFLPMNYMLVDLKVEGKERIYKGWMNVKRWDGSRLRKEYVITYWRIADLHNIRDRDYR